MSCSIEEVSPLGRRRHGGWRSLAPLWVGVTAALGMAADGCSDACCLVDGFPVDLLPGDGLRGMARVNGQDGATLTIDSSAPLTFFAGQADGTPRIARRSFDLLGATAGADGTYPVRARFQNVAVLPVALDPAGSAVVLGADLLKNFSLHIVFGAPAITFWSGQHAPDSLFGAPGCAGTADSPLCAAVLHFSLLGGGELTAISEPDFLGLTGPVEFPATRALLRACAAPAVADPINDPTPRCCSRIDAVNQATGANLALLVATGVGPVILSQSAWNRVVASQTVPPPSPAAGDSVSIPWLSGPLASVTWSELPRLALVDLESDPSTNPGACVELGRARRMEWIERHQTGPDSPACFQPCDADLGDSGKAQNAAAYVELGAPVRVAIVPDGSGFLESLRAELRQQGPQVDGLLGTEALAATSAELDYGGSPSRMIFACAPGAPRSTCWASPRCIRQNSPGDLHSCFGLPPQPRPAPTTCLPSGCS